jgi:hypothetical protein
VDAPSITKRADLAGLRERVDDLSRRRLAALTIASSAPERQQLEAMRFELAEVEWHLTRLESS